ncbi:Abieta-7,13-dien-18-ol hydroxylase [Bertholletia excelsa]
MDWLPDIHWQRASFQQWRPKLKRRQTGRSTYFHGNVLGKYFWVSMNFSLNFITFAAVAVAVIIGLSWMKLAREGFLKKRKRCAPVVGTVFHLLVNFHRVHDYMTGISAKHRTYRFLHLFRSEVYISDPANVEYVLKTNFANYGKGWVHYDILTDLLGDGIFTVDGEKWQSQRKTSSFAFSTKILREFSSEVFRGNAGKLAQVVSKAAMAKRTIDVQELFMKSTLDSVFKVMLGVDLDSIGGTNEAGILFTKAFDEASALTLYRYVDIFWRIKRFINIGSEAKLRACIQVIDKFIYEIIRRKTKQVQGSLYDSLTKKGDILSRFLESNETDPKYLKDIILSFTIAGKDTTAVTLSWFLYMMCKHPEVQEKIAQEVLEAIEVTENLSLDEIVGSISEKALDKMQYLHAALTETLRLYPAVPVDGKLCFSDDTLPDGVSVRRGDQVAYQPYAMGRMKWLWGDDAEEYRPERWLNEDGVFQLESSFKFTAFQAGPRICLGKDFAYRQMKIFSAVLLSSFIFKLSDEQKAVNYRTMLTLQVDGGLNLRAFHRFPHKYA